MPLPISERIIIDIVNTLGAIKINNGYANNVSEVLRPNPGLGWPMKDVALLVVQGNPSLDSEAPQMHKEWIHPIEVYCTVTESETSSTAIDTRLNSIRADVEKRLMVDFNRGGLAINTEIDNPEYDDIEPNAHIGVVRVRCNVRYRTLYNDPYTQ